MWLKSIIWVICILRIFVWWCGYFFLMFKDFMYNKYTLTLENTFWLRLCELCVSRQNKFRFILRKEEVKVVYTISCVFIHELRIRAWADSWWSPSWYKQSLTGLVWFCQLKTNPITISLFDSHRGYGPGVWKLIQICFNLTFRAESKQKKVLMVSEPLNIQKIIHSRWLNSSCLSS